MGGQRADRLVGINVPTGMLNISNRVSGKVRVSTSPGGIGHRSSSRLFATQSYICAS